VLFCYLALVPVVVAQVIAAAALIRRVSAMAESASADPFALLLDEDKKVEVTSTALERFSSGFAMSGAASFAILALFAGTWLLPPYRNRSHKTVIYATLAQLVLLAWAALSVASGQRVPDAGLAGTFATVAYTLPAFLLAWHPTVRAWSVRFEPPPPPLPDRAGSADRPRQ
jgi:hypothetical protein